MWFYSASLKIPCKCSIAPKITYPLILHYKYTNRACTNSAQHSKLRTSLNDTIQIIIRHTKLYTQSINLCVSVYLPRLSPSLPRIRECEYALTRFIIQRNSIMACAAVYPKQTTPNNNRAGLSGWAMSLHSKCLMRVARARDGVIRFVIWTAYSAPPVNPHIAWNLSRAQ